VESDHEYILRGRKKGPSKKGDGGSSVILGPGEVYYQKREGGEEKKEKEREGKEKKQRGHLKMGQYSKLIGEGVSLLCFLECMSLVGGLQLMCEGLPFHSKKGEVSRLYRRKKKRRGSVSMTIEKKRALTI